MKVLLSWLREFAPFEGDPVALGDQMSDLGMAVESIDRLGEGLDGIVVAKVLDLRPHPAADKIQLVDVDAGDGEALQICCGAFNMAVGDLVPLATLGTTMPSPPGTDEPGMRIERRKLRGEWSNGMLCSSRELGLGDDHAGIMVLDPSVPVGADLRGALGITDDVLFDLEINPNRPDALSVAGVARDLAARLRIPFAYPELPVVAESGPPASDLSSVEIVDADLCGRFLVRVLHGVTVGASPAWLGRRLTHLGMRPINSVVDVSNYVMLELGQPNHTYDLDRVPKGALRVRWARPGETLRTLDDVERVLSPADGVIADGEDTAIGIAGVMGGASTEISDATTSVLLEMAWWDPMSIARTSGRLGLRSEASIRFERGGDPEIADRAALRFAELLALSGAVTLAPGTVDERGDLPERAPIRVRTDRVNRFLGTDLSDAGIRELLEPIGFAVKPGAGEAEVIAPSFRPDTVTETDVIEEVARHHGYSRIPRTIPPAVRAGGLSPYQRARRELRQVLLGLGVDEAMPLPFLAPADIARADLPPEVVTLTNPLDADESVLRPSLRPGLLKAVAYNASHRNAGVRLFETGKVFGRPPAGEQLPDEREHLGVALAGEEAFAAVDVWHVLADALALPAPRLVQEPVVGLHPTRGARLLVDAQPVGCTGEIDPAVLARFGIAERVAWLELDLGAVLARPEAERPYRPISRFPSSDVDLAFEVDEATPADVVAATIARAGAPLLATVELFDVYRGEGLPAGRRSLAYRLRLQAADRTLTDADIAAVRTRVIDAVSGEHPAVLRG